MSEQDGTQSSTKQRRNRKTNTTNQKNSEQTLVAQRPANEDAEAWQAYWKEQGQSWRREPEINAERQQYLAERRNISPDIEQGIYPFKDIKLSRADVEWLLAKHENGRGPVYWWDKSQREREGLDLRGADLRQVNLSRIPLARLRGGLDWERWKKASKEQREMAAVHLEEARLDKAHFEGADLTNAHFEKAHLYLAHLEEAALDWAHFEGATLIEAHLEEAYLTGAYLGGCFFQEAYLKGTRLHRIHLCNHDHVGPWADNTNWNDANLSVVNWAQMHMLGEEHEARQSTTAKRTRLYEKAVRTNRQLAVALQAQGLNEDAARFAYRAQLLQRKAFWYQRQPGKYLFFLLLDLLTGYGFKPARSFLAYALVISIFATIYYLLGTHLAWNEAIVISMTAFHGRGFFPDQFHPGDPQALVAAIEAFVGLLIEVTFIATLTQRLFGK